MKATNARTGRPVTLSYAHELFGRARETIVHAYPGDVVGLVNASELRIGDTLYVGEPVAYPPLPTLAPEHFVVVRNRDSGRYKQFRRGLSQLEEEGVVQVLRYPGRGDQEPILAGVGPMQFDVTAHRLECEFGAPVHLETTPFTLARRTDAEGERALRGVRGATVARRADGTRFALFESEFHLRRLREEKPDIVLEAVVGG